MELTSTYFDTSAHDLYAAGVTLRRRHGASDQGWQAKIPDGRARVELQVPDSDDIPAELLGVLTGVRRGPPLDPIAEIEPGFAQRARARRPHRRSSVAHSVM